MKSQELQKRVFVALSGGVDSAVAAAILKERGYDVIGVFIKIWQPEFLECTWREDRLDAMRVSAALEIPFKEVDFSEEYKRGVIDDMLAEYKAGRTPNPDVLCNRDIKFGALWKWAKKQGANYLATGHYARILPLGNWIPKWGLLRGVDKKKDQSYFLWQMTQDDLAHTLMPIGEMTKPDVRAYAKRHNLPVAQKADSQGLCFVGDINMHDFLQRYLTVERGDVVDMSGNVIGEHDGAALYTIGQRHGLTVQSKKEAGTAQYVVSIDVDANTVTVSPKPQYHIGKREISLIRESWIHDYPSRCANLTCAVRYQQAPITCSIKDKNENSAVIFSEPHIATPGQSLVVYCREECLGGGVIA